MAPIHSPKTTTPAQARVWAPPLCGEMPAERAAALVRPLQLPGLSPHGSGLVRSRQNTADSPSHSLLPICAEAINATSFARESDEQCGGAANSKLSIPYGTRSYLLSEYDGACEGTSFGADSYECVAAAACGEQPVHQC